MLLGIFTLNKNLSSSRQNRNLNAEVFGSTFPLLHAETFHVLAFRSVSFRFSIFVFGQTSDDQKVAILIIVVYIMMTTQLDIHTQVNGTRNRKIARFNQI